MNKTNSLFPAERQQQILEILREKLTIRGSSLSGLLDEAATRQKKSLN